MISRARSGGRVASNSELAKVKKQCERLEKQFRERLAKAETDPRVPAWMKSDLEKDVEDLEWMQREIEDVISLRSRS